MMAEPSIADAILELRGRLEFVEKRLSWFDPSSPEYSRHTGEWLQLKAAIAYGEALDSQRKAS